MKIKNLLMKLGIIKRPMLIIESYKPYKGFAFTDCKHDWKIQEVVLKL